VRVVVLVLVLDSPHYFEHEDENDDEEEEKMPGLRHNPYLLTPPITDRGPKRLRARAYAAMVEGERRLFSADEKVRSE